MEASWADRLTFRHGALRVDMSQLPNDARIFALLSSGGNEHSRFGKDKFRVVNREGPVTNLRKKSNKKAIASHNLELRSQVVRQ